MTRFRYEQSGRRHEFQSLRDFEQTRRVLRRLISTELQIEPYKITPYAVPPGDTGEKQSTNPATDRAEYDYPRTSS